MLEKLSGLYWKRWGMSSSQSPRDTACCTVPGNGIRVFPAQAAAMIVEEPAGNLLPLGLILFAVL